MANEDIFLAQLVDMTSPRAVFAEVCHLAGLMDGQIDMDRLEVVFVRVCELYEGRYRGYRACNTFFHDLRHTTDVFLTLARLIHGASVEGVAFPPAEATLVLVSTLLHDTGYLQKSGDHKGTGGKYTRTHVARSVAFLREFLPQHGFSAAETNLCERFVMGTCIREGITSESFPTGTALLLAKMIATADLIGQLADRIYLEKLLFLYREFREADIAEYGSERELLHKTITFYDLMEKRLAEDLSNVRNYMLSHFRKRWNLDHDLYRTAAAHNIEYLRNLLRQHHDDYRSNLKREGLVQKLVNIELSESAADKRTAGRM